MSRGPIGSPARNYVPYDFFSTKTTSVRMAGAILASPEDAFFELFWLTPEVKVVIFYYLIRSSARRPCDGTKIFRPQHIFIFI